MPSHQARRDPLPADYQFPTPKANDAAMRAASERFDTMAGQKVWNEVHHCSHQYSQYDFATNETRCLACSTRMELNGLKPFAHQQPDATGEP